jgi:hypothetical protein
MACVINSVVSRDCKDGIGGAEWVAVASAEIDTDNTTIDASGNVSALALEGGAKFYKINLEKEKALFESVTNGSVENTTTSWTQTLTFSINKLSANKRTFIKTMAHARVKAIIKDNNGNYILAFYTGGTVTASTASTGTAFGDFNGFNAITITSNEKDEFYLVDSSLISALVQS